VLTELDAQNAGTISVFHARLSHITWAKLVRSTKKKRIARSAGFAMVSLKTKDKISAVKESASGKLGVAVKPF
jgi:hypothetical protein